MSVATQVGRHSTASGAMYAGVPEMAVAGVADSASDFVSPKSTKKTPRVGLSIKLLGLRS